ncbi:MAG TPA: hypothetical protein VD970_14245, partial [Acetobacteraceae bacterium]|nr:hypothetical protein [Acetobacteraceae bacterium]
LALLAAMAGAAIGAGAALGGWPGLALGAALLLGLPALARRRLLLDVMLADWRFAVDIARGRSPAYAARIQRFAEEIRDAMTRPGVEEVVLVGHSLGAVFAVQALAEALRRDPRLLARPEGPRLRLIGLGSSVLKIALHPAAAELRADLAALALTPGLDWTDYASRRDALSFERAEAVATLSLPGRGARLESIHPRDMLDAGGWRRIAWQPLRIHRQYVMGNRRRYFLDFALLCCGPLPAGWRADRVLGADGALGTTAMPAAPAAAPAPEERAA